MVNLRIKQSKTVFPSTTIILHGIEVDTLNQTLTLSMNKVTSFRQKLIGMAKRKKVTLKEIQSIIDDRSSQGHFRMACISTDL